MEDGLDFDWTPEKVDSFRNRCVKKVTPSLTPPSILGAFSDFLQSWPLSREELH
jgi:hypothetical protein